MEQKRTKFETGLVEQGINGSYIVETAEQKIFKSDEYNYTIDKRTGYFQRWGATQEQNPFKSFFGPEIADIEITTICNGPGGKLCPFCSPAGTMVNTPTGMIDIKDIKVGDEVWSATSLNTKMIRPRINTVEEKYERLYEGDLYSIELEDGTILQVTDEHPIMVKGVGEVMAKDLKVEHEIYHISDFKNCKYCDGLIDSKKRVKWSNVCSQECYDKHHQNKCLICEQPFIGKKHNSHFCCLDYGDNFSKHPLRQTHGFMFERCYNPKNNSFSHYGEKGIKVCSSWKNFENFLNDMQDSYKPGLELDRVDSTKDYSKDNCRWISKKEQRQNRSQPKSSKNPYKGVSKHGTKWKGKAPTLENNKSIYLGLFETQQLAVEAYNLQIQKIYPESYKLYIQTYEGEK